MTQQNALSQAETNLYRARSPGDLGFSTTFEEQQGFGSWFSSGLTGLLTSKAASEETQEKWFVQRHSIDFGINQVNKTLDAYREIGNHRDFTQEEASEIRELQSRKSLIEEDLSFAYEHLNGDLDSVIDVEGNSFNDRWGVGGEEQDMLMAFLGAVKDNPAYMAGVFTSEILKDLPLSVLAWLGLAGKGAGGAKAIGSALNKLNNIQPKILRGLAKVGTGVGAGAVAGASYEGLYSLLDEGEVKAKNVQAGAAFGSVFGVLGGLGILGRTAKDLKARQPKPPVVDKKKVPVNQQEWRERITTTQESVEDTVDALIPEKQAKELQAPMELMFKEHNKHLFPELVEGTDYKVIHDIQVAKKQGVQKLNQSKAAQLRKDKDGNSVIVINDKLVDVSINKFRKEMREDKDKWFSSLTPIELTLLKGNKDVYKAFLVAHELGHVKQNKMGFPEVTTKEQHLAKEKGANDLAVEEMRRSYEEIQTAKLNKSDVHVSQVKEDVKSQFVEDEARVVKEPTPVSRGLDKVGEGVDVISKTPARLYGTAAVAGGLAYGATSEEGDPLMSAVVAGGAVALGPRIYKALNGKELSQKFMVAKARISKGMSDNTREMKALDAEMQFINDDINEAFISLNQRHALIALLEGDSLDKVQGKHDVKLTPEQLELVKKTRVFLDKLGGLAEEVEILAKRDSSAKIKHNKFADKHQKGAFLQNYFPHIFKGDIDQKLIDELVKVYGRTNTGNASIRTLMKTVEDIKTKYPHLEIIDDPTHALQLYTQAMTRAVLGKRTVAAFKEINLGPSKDDFLPALMTKDQHKIMSAQEAGRDGFSKQESVHYGEFTHPALKGYMAHVNVKHLLDDFFAVTSKTGLGDTLERLLKLNNGLKRVFVFGSLFHAQALFMSSIYSLGVTGAIKVSMGRGKIGNLDVSELKLGSQDFKDLAIEAMATGLSVVNIKRQELVNVGKVPLDNFLDKLGFPGKLAKKGFDAIDKLTWEQMHDRYKLAVWMKERDRLVDAGIDKKVAGEKASEFANDAFGSLDWDAFTNNLYEYASKNPTKIRGKIANKLAQLLPANKRRWLNLGLFAPDWTISNIRIIGKTFTGLPEVSKAMAKRIQKGNWDSDPHAKEVVKAWNMYAAYSLRAGFYTSAMWWSMTELFSDEEPTMENFWEFWTGDDSGKLNLGNGEFMVISKQIAEPIHWLQHPQHTLMNKASVVPKTVMEAMFNKQWFSMKKGFPMGPRIVEDDGTQHYAKWILGKMVPIVTKPLFDESIGWTERFERVVTGFFGFPQYKTPDDERK